MKISMKLNADFFNLSKFFDLEENAYELFEQLNSNCTY